MVHHVHATLQMVGLSAATSEAEWVPNTDIYENEQSFIIRMEIAGASKEDIHIHFVDRTLVVTGKRADHCRATTRCRFRQMEIHYGAFERRLVIPRTVDGERIKASYRNGFLKIELPKVAKSTPVPLRVVVEHD